MRRLRLLISLPVLLLASGTLVAEPRESRAESSITITGRVQAQGKPLASALITLWDQVFSEPTEKTTVATARTDDNGNYELKNVHAGNYYINVLLPGFVTGKENNFIEKLRFVTVVGEKAIDPINFELVREGVITGIVKDADGKPLKGIPITLTADGIPDGSFAPKYAENIRTDGDGRYRVAGMPEGKYRIAAGHWPLIRGTYNGGAGYRRTFYPNALVETQAKVIDISPGSEVTGIDINVGPRVRTFTVRGKIVDNNTGKPVAGLNYILSAYLNGKIIGVQGSGDSRSNDLGEIILQNIPPGEYAIVTPGARAFARKDEPQTASYFGESRHFEVTDQDIAAIEVRVAKAASVAGFVVVEGPAGADVLARVPEMILYGVVERTPVTPSPIVSATIRPDGSFLFTGLKTGKLKINVGPPLVGKPLPLNFVRIERDGVRPGREVELQAGDEITGVRVVMAYATGTIHGVVKLDDGLIPQGLTGSASIWQGDMAWPRSSLDQNGEFILQHLVAGEYKIAVVARDANNRYWTVEQKIKVFDDRVSEATMVLDSKVKPNPAPTKEPF